MTNSDYCCPVCKSVGFISENDGTGRCSFCSGRENGEYDTEEEAMELQNRMVDNSRKLLDSLLNSIFDDCIDHYRDIDTDVDYELDYETEMEPEIDADIEPATDESMDYVECQWCGSDSCYCCQECGEDMNLVGHKEGCSLDPSSYKE